MIEAKIICDSINPTGNRITTFVCTYPRIIHNELLTHRALSRNVSSSRAIPVNKMIERVEKSPFVPEHIGKNQRGMQAAAELSDTAKMEAQFVWLAAAKTACSFAGRLADLGAHKQIANRLLEPFMYVTSLVTATEWGNFFNLRCHKDAQPEFQDLAYAMLAAYASHKPTQKEWGEWHLPFGDQCLDEGLTENQLLKIVTARAARVSYLNFEGDINHEKDYKLHDDLLAAGHMSPFEHAACASQNWMYAPWQSNFQGWAQYRKKIPGENLASLNMEKLLNGRPKAVEGTAQP